MSNRVNKKLMVKSYTSTNEVLSLKRQLKLYQQEVASLRKLIKFQKQVISTVKQDKNHFFTDNIGQTASYIKNLNNTVNKLESFLLIYEDGVKVTSYEIQLSRQRTFEGLCNYHPDKDVAKKRMIAERDKGLSNGKA